MALKLTIKPNEQVIINGCAIRNEGPTVALRIESRADVIRGKDLLRETDAGTPVGRVYFLVQTSLINIGARDALLPLIQSGLADLALVFGGENLGHVFEAANLISTGDYYKALTHLRPLLRHERHLLGLALEPTSEPRRLQAVT